MERIPEAARPLAGLERRHTSRFSARFFAEQVERRWRSARNDAMTPAEVVAEERAASAARTFAERIEVPPPADLPTYERQLDVLPPSVFVEPERMRRPT